MAQTGCWRAGRASRRPELGRATPGRLPFRIGRRCTQVTRSSRMPDATGARGFASSAAAGPPVPKCRACVRVLHPRSGGTDRRTECGSGETSNSRASCGPARVLPRAGGRAPGASKRESSGNGRMPRSQSKSTSCSCTSMALSHARAFFQSEGHGTRARHSRIPAPDATRWGAARSRPGKFATPVPRAILKQPSSNERFLRQSQMNFFESFADNRVTLPPEPCGRHGMRGVSVCGANEVPQTGTVAGGTRCPNEFGQPGHVARRQHGIAPARTKNANH